MTWARLVLLPLLAAVLALTTSCGRNVDLPEAAVLMKESATATGALTRAHLVLAVHGEPPGVKVRNVDGDIDQAGEGKGSLKVNMFGTLIEGDFVIVGGQAYFKGPTGQFEEYTVARTKSMYDTTVILDPDRGLAHLLAVATDTKTEDIDEINGQKAYRITGKLTRDQVKPMVPGIQKDLDAVFWVPVDGPRHVLRLWFSVPDANPKVPTVEATLSNFDKPFTVAKPL